MMESFFSLASLEVALGLIAVSPTPTLVFIYFSEANISPPSVCIEDGESRERMKNEFEQKFIISAALFLLNAPEKPVAIVRLCWPEGASGGRMRSREYE